MTRFGTLCTVLCLCVPGLTAAADLRDDDLQMVQVYYSPRLMPSVQDAVNALNALHSAYSDWRGGLPEGVYATPAMVMIHTNIHTSEDGSQWVPNWGGSFVGGRYVPYMGGSMQSTHSESDSPADVSVTPSEITGITLWSYPNLERDFKFGFDLYITREGKSVTRSFRTSNIDVARQLADAFATLAAVNFTDQRRYYPSLGIRSQNEGLPENYARLNWTRGSGMLIDLVLGGGPAAVAGIVHDDIVFEANGKPVANAGDMRKIVLESVGDRPQGTIDLKVFRGGRTIPMRITVANPNIGIDRLLSATPQPAVAASAAPAAPAPAPAKLGVAVRNMTAAEAAQAKLPSGVLIVGVDAGSLGQQIGLMAGDGLIEINGSRIADMEAMKRALAAGSVDAVVVWRKGEAIVLNGVSKM